MASKIGEDARDCQERHRLFFFVVVIVIIIIVVIIVGKIAILVKILIVFFLDLVFVVIFFHFIRNGVQSDRMSLRHLQFGLAFGAAEDLSLLDFVFIHINFRGTLRAAEHVSILRVDLDTGVASALRMPPAAYYIPQPYSTWTLARRIQCNPTGRAIEWYQWPKNTQSDRW
jgi:hypothetical protein